MDPVLMKSIGDLSFPDSAREALRQIEKCLSKKKQENIPGLCGPEGVAAIGLAEDFLFNVLRKNKRLTNKALHELQLQEVIIESLQNCKVETLRNEVFLTIFGTSSGYQMEIMCKLVSMAVVVKSSHTLDSCAVWMREQGYKSASCMDLTDHIVHDYCHLVPGAATTLKILPTISGSFACTLMTALTYRFGYQSVMNNTFPPPLLLDILTTWVCDHRSMLLASEHPVPIAGLMRWSIMAPVLSYIKCSPDTDTKQVQTLYSKLHLGILNTLIASAKRPSGIQPIMVEDIAQLVETIVAILKMIPNVMENDSVHTSLERLGQILQVAMVTDSVKASKANLRKVCERLPVNRLLTMVLS